jgi:phenylalanyl-tRNA synthetase beta subunit
LCIWCFWWKKSGVSENTNAIFLESAYFNPVSIRKTAKRHQLNTDASFRFERGIDPNITEYALKRRSNNTSSWRRNNVRCSQCIPKENRRLFCVFEL